MAYQLAKATSAKMNMNNKHGQKVHYHCNQDNQIFIKNLDLKEKQKLADQLGFKSLHDRE